MPSVSRVVSVDVIWKPSICTSGQVKQSDYTTKFTGSGGWARDYNYGM